MSNEDQPEDVLWILTYDSDGYYSWYSFFALSRKEAEDFARQCLSLLTYPVNNMKVRSFREFFAAKTDAPAIS